uniref:Uncharacterized protein n=1 Tax=Triticum urartu TaxID=4572 RepID=A0A8R7PK69_TRIUA
MVYLSFVCSNQLHSVKEDLNEESNVQPINIIVTNSEPGATINNQISCFWS